jgi:hypothetical protein
MRKFKSLFKNKATDKSRPQGSSTPTNQSPPSTSLSTTDVSFSGGASVHGSEKESLHSSTAVSRTTKQVQTPSHQPSPSPSIATPSAGSHTLPESTKQSKFISSSITNARIALKHSLTLLHKALEGVPIPGKGVFPVLSEIIKVIEVFYAILFTVQNVIPLSVASQSQR